MKKYFTKNNILYIIFSLSIILLLTFGLFKINRLTFFTASVSLNLLLIIIIKEVIKKFKIKFSKKELLIISSLIVLLYIFYITSILTRKFIYYWDYSCYYNIQIDTIDKFNNGLLIGIKSFISSTWAGEYGSFINFIPQVIFNFTNKSINSYLISCVIVFIPYIFITYSILTKRIIELIKVKKEKRQILFSLSIVSLTLMPILHGTFIYGQPDLFGLALIFLIISLAIDYSFKNIELDRLIMIFLSTYMLTICRRWYIYWIISYYLLYILYVLIFNRKDIKQVLKNIFKFGIVVVIIYLVTLLPFIKNTLINNYSSSYSFYSNGGALYEIGNQIKHLGYLLFIIIIGGLLYGLMNKKYRIITILNIIQYLLIIILFTRIQTMGIHHSLLLLTNYLYGITMFIICLIDNKKIISTIGCGILVTVLLLNMINGYLNKNSILYTDISLKTKEEINYKGIKEVTDWLEKNIDDNENRAYMIVHNNDFNPDKFRNFYTPNSKVHKYLPYGSSIVGVHKFPIELFTSKYIITTEPFKPTSVDEKYNKVFTELVSKEKFSIEKEFIMKDKTIILIYERIKEVDEEEKNMYLNALKEESKQYKSLYADVINNY